MKESGFDKTLILRHYGDGRKEALPKYVKGYRNKKDSSQVLYEKPRLPVIKQTEPGIKKLHYQLIDGSSLIYYPSGNIAVCQSYSDVPGGGLYTNIFSDFPDSALLGTFTPSGNGSVCIPNSSNIVLIYNQKGGMVTNKDGQILRKWKWPGAGKLDDPVIIQVNKYITVRIAGRFAVSLIYKWQHESVRLSLSTSQGVAVPQLESLDQIFTEAKVTSTLAKGFTKTHSKKEEEINTSLKKRVNLSKDTKISGIPEENLSCDFNVMTELKKLRQKIKNILEQWMEYYRIAFGISLPHLHKSSTFPQRGGKKCKTQPACAFLGKNKGYEAALSHNLPPFYSATRTGLTQDMPSESSRAPHLLSSSSEIKQVDTAHNKKFSPKLPKTRSSMAQSLAHTACPVVLQRNMLGEEAKICRCSNHQIPSVTDLEYDHLINNQASSPEQITVVWVTASLGAANYDPRMDEHLEQLYERKNKNRSMPCTQGRLDSFRLLKYDISSADEFTGHCGSLLVKRHNIAPGMVLMYIQGKLLFANYIFNGYSKSAKDLQKQIAITRSSYNRGCYLPTDYRFSLQSYPEYTEATISDDVSRCICYAMDRKESSCDFELFNLYREAACTGIHKHSN
nr:uncharacterized protein C3orf20-like [Pogona vitticeps]